MEPAQWKLDFTPPSTKRVTRQSEREVPPPDTTVAKGTTKAGRKGRVQNGSNDTSLNPKDDVHASSKDIKPQGKAIRDDREQQRGEKDVDEDDAKTDAESELNGFGDDPNDLIVHDYSFGDDPSKLKVNEIQGDLFDAPPNILLLHACNCGGDWGAGIAKVFKHRYPQAFAQYKNFCQTNRPNDIIGTALLIPRAKQMDKKLLATGVRPENAGPIHHIGCLFTSKSIGIKRDSSENILGRTEQAMGSLLTEIWGERKSTHDKKPWSPIEAIWMPKINSGLFGVPWESTKKVLEKFDAGSVKLGALSPNFKSEIGDDGKVVLSEEQNKNAKYVIDPKLAEVFVVSKD